MPKSLGQIHTVNYRLETLGVDPPLEGTQYLIDCPGELTSQLSHMVRTGNSFKVVGIDMTLLDQADGLGGQAVTGRLRYYAPTRGRVLAFRAAYQAVMNAMKIKGINPLSNVNYDFRPTLMPPANYANGDDFKNNATIEFDRVGNDWYPLAIDNAAAGFAAVFDTYNEQLEPRQGQIGNPDFAQGYDIVLGGFDPTASGFVTNPDFVQNEGMYLQTPRNFADADFEEIPFTIANSDGESMALLFNWRPDPALYLSVMLGQFDIILDEVKDLAAGEFLTIDLAIHVAGWKTIMSDRKRSTIHKKKKSRKRRKSK